MIEDVLEMGKGEDLDILHSLHLLLRVPSDDISQSLAISYGDYNDATLKVPSIPPIRICHALFCDYLLDKSVLEPFILMKRH